jgi:TonB family protein
MRRRDEPSPIVLLVATLIASLAVHLLLWPLGDRLIRLGWQSAPLPAGDGWMQVALVDEEEAAEEAPPPEEERRETDPPGKLIKQDRVKKEALPDDAKYVAEFDQKVDHETRAKNGRPKAGAAPNVAGHAPDANNLPLAPNLLDPRPADPNPSAGAPGEADAGRGDPALPKVPSPRSLLPMPPNFGPSGRPGLRGNPAESSKGEPGEHGSMDDIQDVDDGDINQLNSRRWKYASFFNRVRDQVAQHWHPEVVHAARDPDGSRYGRQTRVTRLLIRLNPDGSLKAIKVDQPSDVDFLDEEAIRAVRTAAPFANPPQQLVDPETGFIDFGFGFIFEIESGKPRIFRYRR